MVWFSLVWTPGYGSTTRSTIALAPVTISLTGHFKFSQSAAMAGQLIHYYHQYHGSAKNVYDIIFSSLQMMGIRKYHCTGWLDKHSNIQWTTQCSLCHMFNVHCSLLQCSVFLAHAQYSVFSVMLSVHCAVFSVQCSVFSVQWSMLEVQCSVFNARCSVFSVQSAFSAQCSMANFQCSLFKV